MLSWMYRIMAIVCAIFYWGEGVQATIAVALLLLNSHITEEYEDTID